MATTRLMPLHTGKGRNLSTAIADIIDYVKNPQKTDFGKFIYGYECDTRIADAEFLLSKRQYASLTGRNRGSDDVIAYHLRQAFKPGEVTPEEANQIGRELAMKLTKGNHAFIVCTHVDKHHVHNHVIINSTTTDCTHKFRNFWGSTWAIRRMNDKLCLEHGLSVIENPKPSRDHYGTWMGDKKQPSYHAQLRIAIDAALEEGKPVGIGCAMKNAGVGVGIPDTGRVKLVFEKDKKLHIYSGASCIGQGLGTVLTQMVVTNTDLKHEDIVYERSNTWFAPDSGTTSGSRQTLVTGEACRRACGKVMEDRNAGKTIDDVIGKIYYGEYLAKTDPLGANVPNPVSHVAYGYATQVCILDKKTGKIEEMVAAHDVGKAVNPLSCEGQIEGGVVMSIGFALREHYPIDENCKPIDKYGSLGLFRSHEIPKIDAIVVDKPGLNVACGAIGIGEITSIPTAPAIADAYFRWNGERQYSLPLTGTPYERKC